MNIFDALILGVIEGLTEFLPVSSTGHMILASSLLGIAEDSFTKSFEIIIQLGAILAVVIIFRKKIFTNMRLMTKVVAAFLPTAVIGLALYSFVKKYLLGNPEVVLVSLFLGGIVIILFEKYGPAKHGKNGEAKGMLAKGGPEGTSLALRDELDAITFKQAVYVGLFQAIAIIPGVSRSAATIIGGQLVGLSRKAIVEFSFLLAVPVMLAASALDLYKHHEMIAGQQLALLVVGFVTAFIVALAAIKGFISYVQKHSFAAFGWYRIVLALVSFGVLYFL